MNLTKEVRSSTMKITEHTREKLSNTGGVEKISHVHGSAELLLFKWHIIDLRIQCNPHQDSHILPLN